MTEWVREGLEGRGIRTTLRLYIFGLIAIAPFAALVWLLAGASTAFHVTPLLVGILVGLQYAVSYYTKARGATTEGPIKGEWAHAQTTDDLMKNDLNLSAELLGELARSLPGDWLNLPYREATKPYSQAFDRVYLRRLLDRHRHNLAAAANAAGLDRKTFRERWQNAGLPPLAVEEEQADKSF
jgi:hypothetical protein